MSFPPQNKYSGFTLIEVLVALTILMISLFGFYQVSLYTITQINHSDKHLTSINYLSSGMEIMRGIRDTFIRNNPKNGWDYPDTPEIDSFVEFVGKGDLGAGEFRLQKKTGSGSTEGMYVNNYMLVPLSDPGDYSAWEELPLTKGFMKFLRKIKIENYTLPGTEERMKKITVSVHYDDESFGDTVHMAMYLGNMAIAPTQEN